MRERDEREKVEREDIDGGVEATLLQLRAAAVGE